MGREIKNKKTLKKLVDCIGKNKKASTLTSIFVIFEVVLEVLIPLVMAQIINVGMNQELQSFTFILTFGKYSTSVFTLADRTLFIVVCGLIMIVFALISLICGALAGKYAAQAATGFGLNIRQRIMYKVLGFSFSNLDNYNTASLVTRLTTDITNVQNAFMMIIRLLVRAPIMLILALIMAISISPKLSITFAIALPVLVVFFGLGIVIVYPRFEKMLKMYDTMNETTQENLTGIRAVKAFVREDAQTEKFNRISKKVRDLQYSAEKILVIAFPFMQLLIFACIISIVWFGGNNIILGTMQVGDLSAFLAYVMQIMVSLAMVAFVFIMIVISRASASRIVQVFDEEIDITTEKDAIDDVPKDGSIAFENVNFSYSKNKDVLNLENITLNINSGETVGIIGGTGSAKTTLVQLIPRLYDTFDGTVKVGGIDVKKYKLENLRNDVGMVLQKNVLFSGTIKDNLKWGNENATDIEIEQACKASQAHEFITNFEKGYETDLGQGGVNVSGGQKQRLCIARALLKKPKIMILDDSTSAVDTATDKAIRDGFKKEFGDITVLIIAQRIASVEDADKIIVLDKGKIDAVGTHSQLLEKNEIYTDMYYSQQKGVEDEKR